MKQTVTMVMAAAAVWAVTAGAASAQHDGHQTGGSPQAGQLAPECISGVHAAVPALDALDARLEDARQTNSPVAMRQALDEVRAHLSTLRLPLASCVPTAPTKPGTAPPTHGAAESQAAPMGGMDHSTMPGMGTRAVAPVPAEAVDPVCGMKVTDPRTAPSAPHKGHMYYFCSIGDRNKFLENPDAYAKAKP